MTSRSEPGPVPKDHATPQRLGEDGVQLADMTEGESPQERAQGGRCHHPVRKHRLGGTGSQHVGVVDVAATRHHGVHQGQYLATRKCATHTTRQVDQVIDQAFETQSDHQRGHQQQPSVGHQMGVIEGHVDPVDSARY